MSPPLPASAPLSPHPINPARRRHSRSGLPRWPLHPPASAAYLPPHIQASQGAVQYGRTHRLAQYLPQLRRQKWRAGSPDIGRDTRTTCGAYKCQRRWTREFILSHYIIKQGVGALQGPKSKTHVLIVFKIVEGFKTYLAYINSIKYLKKRMYGGIC